ncbi:MAG: radical SAM protein [Candidatus Latescibacteria bacterium]|nr:radical SAM protein [Candidatus Latescibacterota bacterium]
MAHKNYRYIYGPVFSWRLGVSLGIDPISQKDKICSFDCVYCQIGKTKKFSYQRKIYISEKELLAEINSLPAIDIDYITFSGRGEPTLAKNLGKMIKAIRKTRKEKIAVITNSSLLSQKDVAQDLLAVDFVLAKLDAYDQQSLQKINRPLPAINFQKIVQGVKQFRSVYSKKLALQIMFTKDNIKHADKIAQLAREINPHEIQLNTPLRRCPAQPLSKKELKGITKYFSGFNTISVYDINKEEVKPISKKNTLTRRGKA